MAEVVEKKRLLHLLCVLRVLCGKLELLFTVEIIGLLTFDDDAIGC